VASSIHGPVDILGHSFGAACVLSAAALIPNLRRLILYEPPMLREQHTPQRTELLERMDQALANDDRDVVVITLMRDMMRVPMPLIDRARATPAWAAQVSAAHTIPRELRSSDAYGSNLESLRAISTPTLFLLGSDSPQSFKDTTLTLHELLPYSQIVTLAGQQHSAMLTAPDLFAGEVIRFLAD